MIRVLIAEDQYTCQQIWKSYLEPEVDLEIIGTAIDGQEAIELVEKFKPDVVLMDINMPRMDGLTATEIITNRYVDTKILILSISDNVEYIKTSLKIGAKGYFLKSSDPQELVTAIKNIHLGYCQLGRGLIEKLDTDTSQVSKQQFDQDHLGKATKMEQMGSRELVSQTEKTNVEKVDTTSANSMVVLPHVVLPQRKSKKLVALYFRFPLLMLVGLIVFVFTPPGRKWFSKLTIALNLQPEKVATAQDFDSSTILPVETLKVSLINSYQVDRTYTGTIVPRRSSSLGFRRRGKLLNLAVDLGDRVEFGTPLAVLDTQNLKAKQKELFAERKQVEIRLQELLAGSRRETITDAQSQVEIIQSQLKLSQIRGQRRQELYMSGAISREQYDEAISEANTLKARLNKAQSGLDQLLSGARPETIAAQQALLEQLDARFTSLELELEQSTLKAPFTGIVAKRLVDEGTVVAAGESIFTLIEAQTLEVHVGVPLNAASQILLGSNQELQIGSKTYQSRVLSILPQLDATTRTLTVVLNLDQSAATEVRAGQIARLKLSETIADSGYWLPTTALVRGVRGLWSCYVLGDSESVASESKKAFPVEQREIEVIQTESDKVFVRGTIQNNDLVIVNGNHRLVPSQLVRPID